MSSSSLNSLGGVMNTKWRVYGLVINVVIFLMGMSFAPRPGWMHVMGWFYIVWGSLSSVYFMIALLISFLAQRRRMALE